MQSGKIEVCTKDFEVWKGGHVVVCFQNSENSWLWGQLES